MRPRLCGSLLKSVDLNLDARGGHRKNGWKFAIKSRRKPVEVHGNIQMEVCVEARTSRWKSVEVNRSRWKEIYKLVEVDGSRFTPMETPVEVGGSRFTCMEVSRRFHGIFHRSRKLKVPLIASINCSFLEHIFRGSFHDLPYTPTCFHLLPRTPQTSSCFHKTTPNPILTLELPPWNLTYFQLPRK